MRKTKRRQRLLSLALCLSMLVGALPLSGMAYAAGTGCNHVHDDDCGYVETIVGKSCTFVHVHDETCGYAEAVDAVPCMVEAEHIHDAACGFNPDTGEGCTFQHTPHDGECGYAEAVGASPCSVEAAHSHDDDCGYVEAVAGKSCNHKHDASCGGLTSLPTLPQGRASTIPEMDPKAVGFAGEEWWVIGKDGTGVNSQSGTMTLLSKENLLSTAFDTDENRGGTANSRYGGSLLQKAMENFYNSLSAENKALIVARELDEVWVDDNYDATLPGDHYVWPLSETEAKSLPEDTIRANGSTWWLRSAYNNAKADGVADIGYVGVASVDNATGVRPALTLKLGDAILASASAGEHGSISPSGKVVVPKNGSQTFIITADEGYVLSDVKVGGVSVGAVSRYTLGNPSEDCTIEASFTVDAKYDPRDVAVINDIIEKNGLTWTKDDPDSWNTDNSTSYAPYVTWDDSSPKRIEVLYLLRSGLSGTLDVTGLSNLEYLNCSYNSLDGLNVTGLTSLEVLYCYNNRLTGTLNVSNLSSLQALTCSTNSLDGLNVTDLDSLQRLYCSDNPIQSLKLPGGKDKLTVDISPANSGTVMFSHNNNLLDDKSITLTATARYGYTFDNWTGDGTPSGVTNSFTLSGSISVTANFTKDSNPEYDPRDVAVIDGIIEKNGLTWTRDDPGGWPTTGASYLTWDDSSTPKRITKLFIPGIGLSSTLDVSGLTDLRSLNCENNSLTGTLDATGLNSLQFLTCTNNRLTDLKLTGLNSLIYVYCESNTLTGLNLTGLTKLVQVNCKNNRLTGTLDASGLANLQALNCSDNNLTGLDVSGSNKLRDLYCENNVLTDLDLTGPKNLVELYCSGNRLTDLNVTGLTQLNQLYCRDNPLQSLQLPNGWDALTVNTDPASSGTVMFSHFQNLEVNKSVTLTAAPSEGYRFEKWTENGADVSTNASYPFTLSGERNLTANFVPDSTAILKVTFDDNGDGGTKDNNKMKEAVNAALGSGIDQTKITTIQLTGNAAEITHWNWQYLLSLYQGGSGWTNLKVVDLSGMSGLTKVEKTRIDSTEISNLTTVYLPEGLQTIGEATFINCTGLTGVSFPESLQTIGGYAFSECASLENVSFPKSLQTIEGYAFSKCTGLTAFAVDPDNPNYSSLGDVLYDKSRETLIQYPLAKNATSFDTPDTVQTIEGYAFYGCTSLENVSFPKSLQTIEGYAFYNCSALKSADLSACNKLQTIGNSAFSSCDILESVSFPKSLQTIGGYAFSSCVKLSALTFLGNTSPATINEQAFNRVAASGTVSYPAGASGYDENWKNNTLKLSSWTLVPVGQTITYTVSATANPSDGGTITGGGTFVSGASVTLLAEPSEGYRFVKWTESGADVSTDASYSFTATKNRSLVAVFELTPPPSTSYTVRVSANPPEGGSVSGGGTFAAGASVTLLAAPSEGYRFVKWTESDADISTDASYSFTATKNRSLVAVFELTPPPPTSYTVRVSANPPEGGSVSGGGTFAEGASVTLIATPKAGYTFTGWTGDKSGSDNPLTFTLSRSMSVTANFAKDSNPEYDPGDVAIINGIIEKSNLGWEKDKPENWPTSDPENSGISHLRWDDSSTPKRIKELYMYGVSLPVPLDVTGLTSLQLLRCDGGSLTGLNVSGLSNLEFLFCSSGGLTGTLNVSNLSKLQELQCSGNSLTGLDVTGLSNLRVLNCYNNSLTGLDVSNHPNLKTLNCSSNNLTDLDLTGLASLQGLYCGDNPIQSLKLPGGDELTIAASPANSGEVTFNHSFNLFSDKSVTLAVTPGYGYTFTGWSGGGTLSGDTNSFTLSGKMSVTANFTADPNPKYDLGDVAVINGIIEKNGLQWEKNKPDNWNTEQIISSTYLKWNDSKPKQITELYMPSARLKGALNVAGLTSLEYLRCDSNNLSGTLDVSGLTKLQELYCGANDLSGIRNMADLTGLEKLSCYDNNLSGTLDVSRLTNLRDLSCGYNNLSGTLDVSRLTGLERLDCGYNNLSRLNLTGLTKLNFLICDGNPLQNLKLPGGEELTVAVSPANGGSVMFYADGYVLSNKSVTLTANPAAGYTFDRWTGGGTLSGATNSFTLSGVMNMTANFTRVGGGYIGHSSPDYGYRTLTDTASGVRVSGLFTDSAELEVKETLLHTRGDCPACDDIRERQKNGELIVLFDIALKYGQYAGDLDVEIPVGEQYNGQRAIMLHCNDKASESRTVTVSGGFARGTFSELSAYAVAKTSGGITGLPESYTLPMGQRVSWTPKPAGGEWSYDKGVLSMTRSGDTYTFQTLKKGRTTATYTVNGASFTVTITTSATVIPQTGDSGNTWLWTLLATAALLGCAALALGRKGDYQKRHE